MGELQVFSLVAGPPWHTLICAPTCFSCRAAKLSLLPWRGLVGFGWAPYAMLVARSSTCFWSLKAVITWASRQAKYTFSLSQVSLFCLKLRHQSDYSMNSTTPPKKFLLWCLLWVCHSSLFASLDFFHPFSTYSPFVVFKLHAALSSFISSVLNPLSIFWVHNYKWTQTFWRSGTEFCENLL